MRILLVSQMYPGPDAPDLGTFVAELERALGERGHELERAVLDTRAGVGSTNGILTKPSTTMTLFRPLRLTPQ